MRCASRKAIATTHDHKEVNMKTLMLTKSFGLLAIVASLACLAMPQNSFAEDTKVTCTAPTVSVWASGEGTAPSAQVTIECTGGSSAGFPYYAFEIKANPNVANMIPGLVATAVQENGEGTSITIYSNLSDLSGSAWGCGNSNCRIIDQVYGY
jgi:hypothetical protein